MSDKSQKKKLTILVILLALLSISMFSQLKQETPPVNVSSAKNARSQFAAKASANETLEVELLTKEHPEFSGVKRNIFQFGQGAEEEPAPNGGNPQVSAQPAVPQPPPLPQVYYLGFYFEKDTGLKMASLSANGRILVGKVGQTLAGRFQVVEIASDYVVLRLPADEGKVIRVPLGKVPPSIVQQGQEQTE